MEPAAKTTTRHLEKFIEVASSRGTRPCIETARVPEGPRVKAVLRP